MIRGKASFASNKKVEEHVVNQGCIATVLYASRFRNGNLGRHGQVAIEILGGNCGVRHKRHWTRQDISKSINTTFSKSSLITTVHNLYTGNFSTRVLAILLSGCPATFV